MSTYFRLSDEEIKAVLETMALNREMGVYPLREELPSAEAILYEVANFYGMDDASLKETTVEAPRQMAFYLVRKLTMLSLQEIAALLHSDKDEVIRAIRALETQLKDGNPELGLTVRAIVKEIRGCCENE